MKISDSETGDMKDHEWNSSEPLLDRIAKVRAAAAEPAPERTPPQIQEIAARIHERYNALNCRGYATKDWVAALKATEQEIARAVAVPEPAAQQARAFYCEDCGNAINLVRCGCRARQAAPAPTPSRRRYVLDAILDGDSECFVFEADSAEHFALQNRLLKLTLSGGFSYTMYSAELHKRPLVDMETYLTEAEASSLGTRQKFCNGLNCLTGDCGVKHKPKIPDCPKCGMRNGCHSESCAAPERGDSK